MNKIPERTIRLANRRRRLRSRSEKHGRALELRWLTEELVRIRSELDAIRKSLEQYRAEMQFENNKRLLDASIKGHVSNASRQTQAFIATQNYFVSGQLPAISLERTAWPVSPDFSLYLITLLETESYDAVIEFGSGYSTTLIARVLKRQAQKKAPATQISFEHLEEFHQKTIKHLWREGLRDEVQLIHAPLSRWTESGGREYQFYSPDILESILSKLKIDQIKKILVLIDGPPAATGPQARYPALPIVDSLLSSAVVHYLLDDYIRDDEKEIVRLWKERLRTQNRCFFMHELSLEKDACFIEVEPLREAL